MKINASSGLPKALQDYNPCPLLVNETKINPRHLTGIKQLLTGTEKDYRSQPNVIVIYHDFRYYTIVLNQVVSLLTLE